LLACCFFLFAAQPVTVSSQAVLATCILAIILGLRALKAEGSLKAIFIMLAAFISVRYFIWRASSTLPPVEDVTSFVPAIILLGAELYALLVFVLGVFVVIDPVRRKPAMLRKDLDHYPTVDVFIPSYNEDDEILEATLTAAKHLRYPRDRFRVYLLDDGGTLQKREQMDPEQAHDAQERHMRLRALCERIGVNYLTRDRNERAKAGNINAALGRTDGDLILVLDADHVPTPGFLERTVGYFLEDPKLFLVQTPHFFINPDPVEKNLGTFGQMPSENEMFYGVIQPGLDKWNAAFFCGSAAVLRRQALEEIGGIAGSSITEDAETALDLHALGYNSVYVSEPLVAGLQPDTFDAFVGQRTRWSQGMTQIFVLKNPLFRRGLTIGQRLGYINSSFFWLFPFARLTFLLIPLAYLFGGLQIFYATIDEFAAYTIPHLIAMLVVSNALYGHVRWPFISELYEYVLSIFTFPAIISTILRPRKPTFRVTVKGKLTDEAFVSPLAWPLVLMVGLMFLGLAAGAWRYYAFPLEREVVLIVSFWVAINTVLALAGLGVICEQQQRRKAHRMPVRRRGHLLRDDGEVVKGVIDDLSSNGCRLRVPAHQVRGMDFQNRTIRIESDPLGLDKWVPFTMHVRSVIAEGKQYILGLEFLPQSQEEREDALLMFYGRSQDWEQFLSSRRKTPGLLLGTVWFAWIALRYSALAMTFLVRHWVLKKAPGQPVVEEVRDVLEEFDELLVKREAA
jgi:cellulose synthase (UDP-forming)